MCAQSATTVHSILGRSSAVINRANPCYSDTLLPRQLVAPAGPWQPPMRIRANPNSHKERLGLLIPRLRPPDHLRLAFPSPGTSNGEGRCRHNFAVVTYGEGRFRHNFAVAIALLRLQSYYEQQSRQQAPFSYMVQHSCHDLACMMLSHADDSS